MIGDHYLNTSTQNVYVCTTAGAPSTAKWTYESNIKGATGAKGDNGYIHIKYSDDGGTTFTSNNGEDPGDFMGIYVDNTQADSTTPSAYTWSRVRGIGIESTKKQYYLSTSSTTQSGGQWVDTIPNYISGRFYWSREVTTWSDGSVTNGEAIFESAMTEALVRASLGLGMKINYSAFSTTDPGEVYLHGYTNGEPADVDGFVYWKDVKRTVSKGMINPNTIVPYNRYIYIVLRLTNATSTTGTKYMVWYNSGWKYAITPTPTAVGGTWTWNESTDVVLGQFIEPGSESSLVEAYLYNPPRSASQVQTTSASPYQYSQGAVEWHNANGGTVTNAMTMLSSWADGAFSATTEINGGYIKTHTIESEHLATDAIMSNNFQASSDTSSPFSVTGTFLDLTTGNLYSPNFGIDNTYGTAYLNGEIIATSGRIGNSSASNYWEIGTKTDYNADQSAALIGKGTAYIQVGEFQLSNGLLNTRHYNASNQITYPVYDNTYWDFGIQSPILDSSTTGYVSGIDDNFIYIRKHANTIPSLKTDWDYVFRVDKNGMVWINGESLDQKYAAIGSGSAYVVKEGDSTINGSLTVTGSINGTATSATQLTHWISINGTQWSGSSNTTIGTLGVGYGGTGATSFTSGAALIGNGSGAIQTRSITNNTTATYITGSTNLITANTLKFFNGAYDSSHNSNLEYVKLGKLGDVVTHDLDEFITTDGGIIDGSLQVTDLTAGNLIVTGAGRFTNGLYGDLTGNASTADKVNHDLIIKLNSGTTEGTNMFTFNGSAAKTVNVTKSAIGLGNVENTALSTWSGSSNLTTTKVGTLAGAAVKAVDTSISAGSTSANLPTSAAVASFVEGKGYVTSSGVTSITLTAGAGISLNATGAITTTGSRTITNTGVRAISESTANGKISVNTNGTVADVAVHGVNKTVTTLASNDDGKLVLTYLDGTTSDPIEVKIIGQSGSSVSYADALNVNGTAIGSASQPVFINAQGKPQTANTIPSITLNGSATTSPSFYAPTAVGTSGQVLKSNGSGAPSWVNQSTLSVGSATTATKFSSARTIALTGDTKGSASADGSSGWSITTNTTTISGINSSGTAQSGTNSRPTTANTNYHDNKLRYYIASTSMETGKPSGDGHILHMAWDNSGWDSQLAVITSGPHIQIRSEDGSGNWGNWVTALDSVNYTDYTVQKDGTGASGTWGINVSGNANSSTYPRIVESNELRFDVSTKPSSATTLCIGYKWSDATADAKINQYNFYNGNAQLAKVVASTFYGDLSGNATSATKATQDSDGNAINTTYAKLSGATFTGAVTGTSFGASSYMSVNTGNSGTAGGLALYSTSPTQYGIAMRQTSNCGKHGYVQGDWATAFYMSASANVTNRGWIFRSANTTAHNVASISGEGHAVFNGSVTVGGNTTNDSGCRMEYNSTTASLDFVFN